MADAVRKELKDVDGSPCACVGGEEECERVVSAAAAVCNDVALVFVCGVSFRDYEIMRTRHSRRSARGIPRVAQSPLRLPS